MSYRCHLSVRSSHKRECSYATSLELMKTPVAEDDENGNAFFLYVMDISYFSGNCGIHLYCDMILFKQSIHL